MTTLRRDRRIIVKRRLPDSLCFRNDAAFPVLLNDESVSDIDAKMLSRVSISLRPAGFARQEDTRVLKIISGEEHACNQAAIKLARGF
jgi:hypothetical protein